MFCGIYVVLLMAAMVRSEVDECRDNHRYCPIWADSGMCDPRVDNGYVIPNCRKSCGSCVDTQHKYLTMVKPLRSTTLRAGDSMLLEARAQGNPLPRASIVFSRSDGYRRVLDTTVLEGDSDTIIVSYHIPEVKLEDGGVYIATFENNIGREETRSIVNVTQLVKEPKLEILRGLEKIEVKKREFLLLEVEVESDVVPDYSELYHYREEQWEKLDNFDFYSLIPGRFIGRYQVVSASSHDSGEYMFTVGTRNLGKKSFGRVNVLTQQVLLEFREDPGNITIHSGENLAWSANMDFYPEPPTILVYRVQDYLWTKVEDDMRVGRSREVTDDVVSTFLAVEYYKEQATPDDQGQYVVLAAGNGLNRKLTFWVHVTEDIVPDDDLINDVIHEDLFDNYFDDVPTDFVEPRFASSLMANLTAKRGAEVKLNVVAYGSDKFRLTLFKESDEGEDLMLAGASPSIHSNWLNLTYVIDNLENYNVGLYKAVLSNGPFIKAVTGWVGIDDTDRQTEIKLQTGDRQQTDGARTSSTTKRSTRATLCGEVSHGRVVGFDLVRCNAGYAVHGEVYVKCRNGKHVTCTT